MIVTSSHVRNLALGWDISAAVKAEQGEGIARAQIIVNGFKEYDKTFNPPIRNWQQQLNQRGQFPGSNSVEVIATNDKGEDTEADDSWD